jgi:KaiC/GvpD/RAD55 family RecA-like ATPase
MSEDKTILERILETLQNGGEGWANANKPFTVDVPKSMVTKVTRVSKDQTVKKLTALKTGTFLDKMFLDCEDKPIGGLPTASNSILTGLPNSGKSLLMDEVALRMSSEGHKVILVLSEEIFRSDSGRFDLESRLKEKAKVLGLDWTKIAQNLFVLDTITNAELRDWSNFVTVYRSLCETEKIEVLLVDSMTLLEDNRGSLKFRLLELSRYNQKYGITSIVINQRAIEEADTLAMAGGIGLSHIVDTVLILDYKRLSSWDGQIKLDTGAKQTEMINFFRILKCRICKCRMNYFQYDITKNGLVCLREPKTEENPKT